MSLQSIRVADYMATQLLVLSPGMTMADAIQELLDRKVSGAPVVQDGKLVGVFSESDCLKEALHAGYHNTGSGTVGDYMTRDAETIAADESIITAAEIFLGHKRRRLPVLDASGKLVGQISRRDVLRAMASVNHQRAGT